jgi:Mce-associated membrane protein
VEDQQPAAGDLTVDADPETDVTEAAQVDTKQSDAAAPLAESEADGSEDTEDTGEDSDEETDVDAADQADDEEEAQDEGKKKAAKTKIKTKKRPRTRPKRLIGKRVAVAVAVVTALLFVGSAAFTGTTMREYLSERATVATKLKVARTAANAITTLWSYTPENMDTLADRAANYLSGDFAAQYRKFVDQIVAPNRQAKISNSTLVTGAAVESLDGPNAIAIVYTNSTSSSPLTKNIPTMKLLSYRLIMKHDRGRWLVTRMTTVTSLDLTPHL